MSLNRRPAAVASEIRLKRALHPGPFLVVEGRDDRLFCERYTDSARCSFVVAESKQRVLEIIRILDCDNFPGVLGMVDPDFDILENSVPASPNIVMVDAHDLEVALLGSPALDRLLVERGSRSKIASLSRDVRSTLLSAAEQVGYLRWLSHKDDLGLRFQGLNLAKCTDRRTLELDPVEMCRRVKNLSQRPGLDEFELAEAARALSSTDHDRRHVCCGDDAIGMLLVGLRSRFGTKQGRKVSVEGLRRELRLALDDADFDASALGTAIRDWERRNPEFRVLK